MGSASTIDQCRADDRDDVIEFGRGGSVHVID
jgi:hypothetical protein